jgi:ppGpp synthetase/RelA/SpoT-type nucleotidyltranferase
MAKAGKLHVMPDDKELDAIVEHFKLHQSNFDSVSETLSNDLYRHSELKPLIHSIKHRTKDPLHLRDKLVRKRTSAKNEGKPFDITVDNVFEKLTDLAGVRLLHLHTSQFPKIDKAIREVVDELGFAIVEGPTANTWDDEYRQLFTEWGATAVPRESMYTSVHYILDSRRRTPVRCELQVRTLMEEVWGEVSHTVNYPRPTTDKIVNEQLKVLARFTSGCTRLVDTIFHK